jgi:hypothetical protein
VPRPFVAYLRVYEPLSSFGGSLGDLLRAVIEDGVVEHARAGIREREVWFRSQLNNAALPGELPDGRPAPSSVRDVLVIDPAEVHCDEATVGPGPLVCPLDVRARSAAALMGFLETSTPMLRAAMLSDTPERLRARAAQILGDLPNRSVHVVSTTWTVPLPWFSMVDPAHRHVVVAPRDDPRRQVYWRVAMGDARRRIERAATLAEQTFGDAGPTRVLIDTAAWLENFDDASAVELDYGGLVQLFTDEELLEDTSADDVNGILDAIEASDAGEVADRFTKLRDFWAGMAIRERFN